MLTLVNLNVYGQRVSYNQGLNLDDGATKEVFHLFENYLASKSLIDQDNPYWNSADQAIHEEYDFLESEFQPSLYMGFPAHVMSIKFVKDICFIKVQFSYCKEDGSPYVLAIVNYVAKRENGSYKLYNSLNFNRQDWNCTTVGIIDFYYPKYHNFDYARAEDLYDFVKETCEKFDVEPRPFEYYFADDYDEIQALKGIDFYIGMGGVSLPSGKASDDKVYSGGLGEFYPHEVYHLQIDKHYPNKHFWVSEGIATWLGGSRGKSLNWHIHRTNSYLQKHPEMDLSDMLTLTNLDNQTAYHYVLGGLIAKKVMDKGGWSMMKSFMTSGKTDEEYYNAIEKLLGVKRKNLNSFLREQLALEAQK